MDSQAGEQQALRMSILYDTSLLISVAASYDEILGGISRHLKAVIPVDHAWLVAFSGQDLQIVASGEGCTVMPVGDCFAEEVLQRVANQEENGIFAGRERIGLVFAGCPAPATLGSLLVCPLQQGDRPEGFLVIGADREDAYSRDDILLLFLLGLQLATVLRNIRLHNDLMAANSRLNLIFDNIEEGILLLDMEGLVQSCNPPVQERYFRDAPPAPGTSFFEYLLGRKKLYRVGTWSGALRRIPEKGAAAFPLSFELVRESGEQPETPVVNAPLVDALLIEILLISRDQDPAGMLVLIRDIGEMKKADELRKDLTAMLVHDLRSPLGIINWNMELMLEGVTGAVTAKQEKLLRGTIENSRELLEMVDSLLDIDRLETGSLTLDIEEFSLGELVASLIEHMEVLAGQMSIRFVMDCGEALPTVRADRSLLRRILFNLFFNAAKYSPPGSAITITARYEKADDRLLVCVRDQGPGVLKQYRNLIFDKYVQVKARSRGELKSKGLGLTFCKLAVEAHHGTIWVEGEAGQGAVFCFTLPREYRATPP